MEPSVRGVTHRSLYSVGILDRPPVCWSRRCKAVTSSCLSMPIHMFFWSLQWKICMYHFFFFAAFQDIIKKFSCLIYFVIPESFCHRNSTKKLCLLQYLFGVFCLYLNGCHFICLFVLTIFSVFYTMSYERRELPAAGLDWREIILLFYNDFVIGWENIPWILFLILTCVLVDQTAFH